MAQLLIATNNLGKLREIRQILNTPDFSLDCLSLTEVGIAQEIAETGDTYAANALLKAEFAARTSGLPSLGDDSGLEVDALGGRPGLYSARYAPTQPERWTKLLSELKDVPWEKRTATFRCVVALVAPGHETQIVEGNCTGYIGFELKGSGGFGYDPLFFMPEFNCTMAELEEETKNRVSHRGRAVLKAKEILREWAK
jgi:XTP/dITP diphosphohydrolase